MQVKYTAKRWSILCGATVCINNLIRCSKTDRLMLDTMTRMKKGLGEQEWGNLRLNDLKSLGLFLHTLRDDDTAFAL